MDKNSPQRERQPELKEVLISIENLSNKYDGLTVELKNKIEAIYTPPDSMLKDPSGTATNNIPPVGQHLVGAINEQIVRLSHYAERLEMLLLKMNGIV